MPAFRDSTHTFLSVQLTQVARNVGVPVNRLFVRLKLDPILNLGSCIPMMIRVETWKGFVQSVTAVVVVLLLVCSIQQYTAVHCIHFEMANQPSKLTLVQHNFDSNRYDFRDHKSIKSGSTGSVAQHVPQCQ